MRRDNIQVAFLRSQIGLTSRSIGACHARTPSILVSSSIELLMGPLLRSGKGRFDVWALLTTDADVDDRRQEHNFAPKQEGPPAAKQRRLLQSPPIDKSNNLPQSRTVYVQDREVLAAAALRRMRMSTPTKKVFWSREPEAAVPCSGNQIENWSTRFRLCVHIGRHIHIGRLGIHHHIG